LDVGWLRFLVDACDPPEPDECGVVALSSLFELSDAVWVGIRVGDDEDELAPRQLPGAKFPATPGDLGGLRRFWISLRPYSRSTRREQVHSMLA
jgi:hypothetical protein